jgi:hypothetical protein
MRMRVPKRVVSKMGKTFGGLYFLVEHVVEHATRGIDTKKKILNKQKNRKSGFDRTERSANCCHRDAITVVMHADEKLELEEEEEQETKTVFRTSSHW